MFKPWASLLGRLKAGAAAWGAGGLPVDAAGGEFVAVASVLRIEGASEGATAGVGTAAAELGVVGSAVGDAF